MARSDPGRSFQDQVVWITGGGSGMGRAMARCFAGEGAHVAVSGRRADRLEETVRLCGGDALSVPCDVTDAAAVRAAVAAVVERFGRLNVAIANAGSAVGGRVEELSAEDWRHQLDVNVVGVASTARWAIPHLREVEGRIAIVCSVSGLLCSPGMAAFHASKYAARALGQTLAMELHGSGVTCTLIHPGFVEKEDEPPGVRPKALLWAPERAARRMVEAIRRRDVEYVFTGHGKAGAFVGQHAPTLAHYLITRFVRPEAA